MILAILTVVGLIPVLVIAWPLIGAVSTLTLAAAWLIYRRNQ